MNKKQDINDCPRRLIIGLDFISLFSKQIEKYFNLQTISYYFTVPRCEDRREREIGYCVMK